MSQAVPEGAPAVPGEGDRPRTLAVFAHPDDETLSAGPVLATMARRGHVTLVTTNRGERGEVIGRDLAHLAEDPQALGRHRAGELRGALTALGIQRHYFFDELPGLAARRPPRYTDSGMQWPPGQTAVRAIPADDVAEDAFSLADPDVTARLLAALLRTERPHLVLTDEPDGGYGHPDHVASHRVTMAAVRLAADAEAAPLADDDPLTGTHPWRVPVVAWVVRPEGQLRRALTWLADHPDRPRISEHTGGPLQVPGPEASRPSIVRPDDQVDLDVPLSAEVITALGRAMSAHRTQIQTAHTDAGLVADSEGDAAGWFGLSNDVLQPAPARATAMVAPGWGSAEALRALVQGEHDGVTSVAETGTSAGVPGVAGNPAEPSGSTSDAGPGSSAGPGSGPDVGPGPAPGTGPETGPLADPRWYSGVMLALAGVLAVLLASITTVFHRWNAPYGLILALLAVLTGSVLARALADRRGQVAYTGVLFVVVLAMTYLGNGDVIVANEAIGVIWLLGAPLVSVLGLAAPRRWFSDG